MSPSPPKAADPGEAGRLFREGHLADALTAATAAVRKAPTDIGARILMAELLVFTGNIDRADVVLDACADVVEQLAKEIKATATLPDGSWHVELNTDVLQRILVNNSYAARVGKTKGKEADRNFI